MKLKKRLIITLSAVVLIFIISLLVSPYVLARRFDSFIGRNRNKITRVNMINGSNGLIVSTTDRSKIEKIISIVDNRKYSKNFDQQERNGFNYAMEFYVSDKKVLTMVSIGQGNIVNGTRYNVDKLISVEEVKTWFDSLPSVK